MKESTQALKVHFEMHVALLCEEKKPSKCSNLIIVFFGVGVNNLVKVLADKGTSLPPKKL